MTGSIKFDNVNFDRHCEPVQRLRKLVGLASNQPVWIMGSTQAPEELAAAKSFLTLSQQYPDLKLIVVPRHPERFEAVYRELSELPLRTVRRTQLADESPLALTDWQVLLVDTVGELRWWWGLADIAIVGGSFGNRGGQNMLEPAAYGANVAFGPNTINFRDIARLLLDANAADRIEELDGITHWVAEQLASPQLGVERGQRAQELIRKHQGALLRTTNELQQLLFHSDDLA